MSPETSMAGREGEARPATDHYPRGPIPVHMVTVLVYTAKRGWHYDLMPLQQFLDCDREGGSDPAANLHSRPRTGLSPCGTHAAFNRHRTRGEEPCLRCVEGERAYQRSRPRRRRAA